MQLKEIMMREVNGIRPDASLTEAIDKLRLLGGEPLAVYDGDRLVGMLTEHDIIEWTSRGGRDTRLSQVRDVMEREVTVCFEDQDVEDAAQLVKEKHAQGVLVVKRNGGQTHNQHPIGTVSLADLAVRSQTAEERAEVPHPQVFLQPIAPPSILGLYGFAGATFMVAAHWANWFTGNVAFLFPFAAIFGGLAQFLAGMWAYKARDGLATAIHGTWGSFWMAYGLLQLLFATGTLTEPSPIFAELGFWFIVLSAITFMGMIASLAQNIFMTGLLLTLTGGSVIAAYSYITGNASYIPYAGGLLIASSIIAWYTASALLFENTFRRTILPLGKLGKAANIPARKPVDPIEYRLGEPGVKMGQ